LITKIAQNFLKLQKNATEINLILSRILPHYFLDYSQFLGNFLIILFPRKRKTENLNSLILKQFQPNSGIPARSSPRGKIKTAAKAWADKLSARTGCFGPGQRKHGPLQLAS
jgi:hypothetical protein